MFAPPCTIKICSLSPLRPKYFLLEFSKCEAFNDLVGPKLRFFAYPETPNICFCKMGDQINYFTKCMQYSIKLSYDTICVSSNSMMNLLLYLSSGIRIRRGLGILVA